MLSVELLEAGSVTVCATGKVSPQVLAVCLALAACPGMAKVTSWGLASDWLEPLR